MRRLWFLYLAFAVALLSGCATTSQQSPRLSADQLKSLGEKALSANDTGASLRFLTEAERERPHDAGIEYDLALAYNQRGFKDQALQHIKKALEIKPDYPEALNTIGYMYAVNGQFDLAKDSFTKALNDPFYQTPQIPAYNLGRLYEDRGDYTNALAYYRQAVKLAPGYAQAWYEIGRVLERTGKNDEARNAYEKAVQESSDMPQAWLRLGIMSYRAGDFKSAAGAFGQVQRAAPGSALANEAQKYLQKINTPAWQHLRDRRKRKSS
ncbi:MAG: tetratricopeptide repeat protein [Syntrophobacteraceae bacterium]